MSIYSEHAQNASRIMRDIAQIEADRIRRKGDFVGSSLSMLGNLPMELIARREAGEAARERTAREEEDRRRKIEKEGLDAENVRGQIEERAGAGAERARKAKLEQAARMLGVTNAQNWGPMRKSIVALVPEAAEALPDTFPPPEVIQGLQRALVGDVGKPLEAPKGPSLITGVGPDGKPIRVEDKPGAQPFMEPKGQTTPANPTVASLAALAATGDPTAQKALDIIKRQQAGSQSPNLVPVPGADGKPVYGTPVAGQPVYEKPGIGSGDTAMDRQRHARTQAAQQFLNRLNTLRETINTKMGPAAGISGTLRRGRASIGLDPDVAEYERERAAAGRALAVAIMGAQNLSDADAKAWADMLPGATIDKETAQRLMTQVETMLTTLGGDGKPPTQGSPSAPQRMGPWTFTVEP